MEKVSIIIPVYNCENYILECLNSVLNQSYKNLEVIVIDDCSTDKSYNIINSIKDKRLKVIRFKKNSGVSKARNRGIKEATGQFICFLDADDCWKLSKIKKQVNFMKKKNCEFIYSSYTIHNSKKNVLVKVPKRMTYEDALKNTTIFTSTVMFNMNFLKKEDLLMEDITIGQDTLCWWKILKKGITAYGMEESLSIYRVGEKSLSSNKIRAVLGAWKIYKMQNLGLFRTLYSFANYLFNAVRRRI